MSGLPHLDKNPVSEQDWFDALIRLARFLRTPEGCPWDREQSALNFAGFLESETKELIEALELRDNDHAEEEFGDVFFTLLATAAAAEEAGMFKLHDALERIHEKMIRRHQHVFGDAKAETPEDAIRVWEEAKAKERAQKSGA